MPDAHVVQSAPAVAVQQMAVAGFARPAQAPLVHSEFAVQLAPAGAFAQRPPMHDPEAQLPLAAHACPATSLDLHTPLDVT